MKNYKNYLVFTAAIAIFSGCQGNKSATNGDNGFTIQGKLNNATAGNVYLFELDKQQFVPRDTAQITENGTFNFEGETAEPSFYRVTIDQRDGVILVLDKGTDVKLEADAKNLNLSSKIEGSNDSQLFQELNKMVNEKQAKEMELQQRFVQANSEGNTAEVEKIRAEFQALQGNLKSFLAKHPTSVVSTFL